LHKYSSYA